MAIPIAVIGRQRSGTTVYRNLLAANGAFDCGEILHSDFKNDELKFYWHIYQQLKDDALWLHPNRYPTLFKQFLQDRILSLSASHVLLDIKYNALRLVDGGMTERSPSVIRQLAREDAKFLHVARQNKLRVFASLLVAEKTKVWRNTGEGDLPIEQRKVNIPPGLAFEVVTYDTRLENQVNDWLEGVPLETIQYEAMFADDGAFSEEAFAVAERLLDRPVPRDSAAKVPLKKQNPEPLAEIATNYDELRRRFEHTQFEWMLAG